jgi:beta-galactosidase
VYRAFHRRNVALDVIAAGEDLSAYRLVIAPALHVLSEAVAGSLRRFVEQGGVLVVTPRAGVKDEQNAVVEQPLPGLLAELCGVEVEEYDSLPAGDGQPLASEWLCAQPGEAIRAETWCDILRPATAEVLAQYTECYYAGRPAITRNHFGRGQAIYVGTFGNDDLWSALARELAGLAGLSPVLEAPAGVELAERWQAGRRLQFVLNHSERDQPMAFDRPYRDLLDGAAPIEGAVVLPPHAVMVLEEAG